MFNDIKDYTAVAEEALKKTSASTPSRPRGGST